MASYTLTEEGGTLHITLPKGTNWVELVLGTAVAAFFTKILLPAAILSFQRRPWHIYDHMLMYGGFGFALSLVSSLLLWVWALLGKQSLTLDGATLVHRREVLGIGFSREYQWSAVQDFRLRVQTPARKVPGVSAAANFVFNLEGAAVMAFDYGARTFEIGRGLDESSANELVTRINQRFPAVSANV